MGILRTLFAIAVVFAHSCGFVLVGGRNAVQLFYIISGFLISYILVEKKTYPSTVNFYINRYLRIYPIYFVIALLSLVFLTATNSDPDPSEFFRVYRDAPWAARTLLVFSNATLFLQDWVMFAGVDHQVLAFATNFRKSDVVLWPGLLVPQAWTLGVELSFYLIAPFILRRRGTVVLLLAMSVATRLVLVVAGLGTQDPWTYRFFPAELAFFLTGALAHQWLLPWYRKRFNEAQLDNRSKMATGLLVAITLTYWLIPAYEIVKMTVLFGLFVALLPLTFIFQSRQGWDRWVGDLSYPIYIGHMLVINVLTRALDHLGHTDPVLLALLAVGLSIVVALILNACVATPVEWIRQQFRGRDAGETARPPLVNDRPGAPQAGSTPCRS